MRIAQISPLYESVPPKFYGGIERIVSYLTEELVRLGHQVTLFASGDSQTTATLRAPVSEALRLDPYCWEQETPHLVMLEQLFRVRQDYDVVHFHLDYRHFPFVRREPLTHLTTVHSFLNFREFYKLYREYAGVPLVSISNSQREGLEWSNWLGTVYNGLPVDLHFCRPQPGAYLAFLGRIAPTKGIEDAIMIARQAGIPLKIAAKVDRADDEYYQSTVKPLLDDANVEFIGEIGEAEKGEFLGNAAALIFPIKWPEPFGLVMIEAMACGTPVIAYPRGSVPEVIDEGVTGFIVDSVQAAVAAVGRLGEISRSGCREVFEKRFTSQRMAMDYLKVYRGLRSR